MANVILSSAKIMTNYFLKDGRHKEKEEKERKGNKKFCRLMDLNNGGDEEKKQ